MISVPLLGIVFALLAALSSGVEKLLRKKVAINVDALTFAFFFELIGAVFAFPLFIANFNLPEINWAWWLVLVSGFLWAGVAFTMVKSYKHLEASFIAPVSRSRIILILILSVIFLSETLNFNKIAGTSLVFAGLVFLSYKKGVNFSRLKEEGMIHLILSIVFISAVFIVDKFAVNFFNPSMYTFMIYFTASVILLPGIFSKKEDIKHIVKSKFILLIILTAALSVLYYYFTLAAFKFAEASVILPITELSSLVAVFGGIFFLNERTDIKKKIVSTIIIIAGVVLISLS